MRGTARAQPGRPQKFDSPGRGEFAALQKVWSRPLAWLAPLATVQSADIVLPTTDGREIRLRRVTTPSPEQKTVLVLLGLTLPQRLDLNFECRVNSATA